jgi:hypothetical protein
VEAPLELLFVHAPGLQPSRRHVARRALVDDAKAAWLVGEEAALFGLRATPHSHIALRRVGAAEALDPCCSLLQAGLRSGDTLLVDITPSALGACPARAWRGAAACARAARSLSRRRHRRSRSCSRGSRSSAAARGVAPRGTRRRIVGGAVARRGGAR